MRAPHPNDPSGLEERVAELRRSIDALRRAVGVTFLGHEAVVEMLVAAVLAEGHVLLEGAPGLGKTTLVRSIAGALDLEFQRIQFTPDLMPADILGSRVLEQDPGGERRFTFHRGAIFANVVLADEINRATPRTQSALLEAMQERQVTAYGETMALPDPFAVIATQNPIEMEGTYPLPEAQLDRFIARLDLRAPSEEQLVAILAATTGPPRAPERPALGRDDVLALRRLVRDVPASSDVLALVARLVVRTSPDCELAPDDVRRCLRYGASPRGGQAVLLLAKAHALLRGRLFVSEEDVAAVCRPALRHRLIFGFEGEASGLHPDELVGQAFEAARK